MTVRDIQHILESWAPKELCWKGDNVGLQVGSPGQQIRKILITLDVSEQVIAEAKKKHANLIISHHPLLFTPLLSLTPEHRVGKLALSLAASNIALISAHTNLDFTARGVSFALAEQIGLTDVRVLVPQQDVLKKIVVFVPPDHVENVMQAMANAGAGHIGNYDACSFQSSGTGTFRGNLETKPFIGSPGKLERVDEICLEMIVQTWNVEAVVRALKAAHPYEEAAYDIYPMDNTLRTAGAGTIGSLPAPEPLEQFLKRLSISLKNRSLRYTGRLTTKIKSVAVCGGSGSQLLAQAISSGADAYVTADVKYHTFQEAESRIVLIDAGHFETETPILKSIVTYLKHRFTTHGENIPVFASTSMSNPVHYYIT